MVPPHHPGAAGSCLPGRDQVPCSWRVNGPRAMPKGRAAIRARTHPLDRARGQTALVGGYSRPPPGERCAGPMVVMVSGDARNRPLSPVQSHYCKQTPSDTPGLECEPCNTRLGCRGFWLGRLDTGARCLNLRARRGCTGSRSGLIGRTARRSTVSGQDRVAVRGDRIGFPGSELAVPFVGLPFDFAGAPEHYASK